MEDHEVIEFNGWQYEIDFLKEIQKGETNAFDSAVQKAMESEAQISVVTCGYQGVMAFQKNLEGSFDPFAYMEESLDNFVDIWVYVSPKFRTGFEIWHFDFLLDALESCGGTSSVKEFSFDEKRAACEVIKISNLP